MKRADKIVSTQSKNPSNQSEDLQSFLKEMLEELSSKYNASGPTETLEEDLPLKDGTLIASFPPNRTQRDKYGSRPNINPANGRQGTRTTTK